jgi:glycosyltransferase involved in cell wall biosynthesis
VILLSHPTANQNVRQTALALAEDGLLEEFWTCVDWKQSGFLDRCLSFLPGVRKELRRRSFSAELTPFIKTFPWREWGRLMSGRIGLNSLAQHETGFFSMDAVYHSLDRHVARRLSSSKTIKAVYAYDDAALESFRIARSRGMKCIYEHPIVYWRQVREYQREEAALHPEWAPTLGSLRDSDEKLARKDEELALADVVITSSTFSRDSLSRAPGLKANVHVVHYGAPPVSNRPIAEVGSKLRVIFVGALSQAKGLGYLLEAADHLKGQIELTLIGHRVSAKIPAPAVLDRHRWIQSLPHDKLLEEIARHDVLVFPSLHEGFGLVIAEAMAQGLAVITTPHTAGPDLITNGVDGFIVPIRSADAIEERLVRLTTNRDLLAQMKLAARQKAAIHQWETYRRQLASLARAVVL